jgi:hypothetical protein
MLAAGRGGPYGFCARTSTSVRPKEMAGSNSETMAARSPRYRHCAAEGTAEWPVSCLHLKGKQGYPGGDRPSGRPARFCLGGLGRGQRDVGRHAGVRWGHDSSTHLTDNARRRFRSRPGQLMLQLRSPDTIACRTPFRKDRGTMSMGCAVRCHREPSYRPLCRSSGDGECRTAWKTL